MKTPKVTPEFIHLFHVSIARSAGSIAYYSGQSVFDCPHKPGTDLYEVWVDSYIVTEKKYFVNGLARN